MRGMEKKEDFEGICARFGPCVCALVRAFLRGCLGSPGIKCRWMSHRFIPIPVISYLRGAEGRGGDEDSTRTKGEE